MHHLVHSPHAGTDDRSPHHLAHERSTLPLDRTWRAWLAVLATIVAPTIGPALGSAPTCEEASWIPTFGGTGGVTIIIDTLVTFDDGSGSGPALYAGGALSTAGGHYVNGVARWDGTAWTPLGDGVDSVVRDLVVFDDGTGNGPELYACGAFLSAGGQLANRIAKWNGERWAPLGSGLTGTAASTAGYAMSVFDDGSGGGPALYVGGIFTHAGGQPASRIAKWNGTQWSAVGSGLNSSVYDLTVFDNGSGAGPALYAGGGFSGRVARWNGTQWTTLGTGIANGTVYSFGIFDDGSGSGPALYAGGNFQPSGGWLTRSTAKLDGSTWKPLGTGTNGDVRSLIAYDDGKGAGPALYAGGHFSEAGGLAASNIARWNGTSWSAVDGGVGAESGSNVVYAMEVFDDGNGRGPLLHAGGMFTTAGDAGTSCIATWNGATWEPLSAIGLSHAPLVLTTWDDGSGGGSALYAGGRFTTAGEIEAKYIARWDGASWAPLGSGMNFWVMALAAFDDGSGGGPALYAGGRFTSAGGSDANGIAKWDGKEWTALGQSLGSEAGVALVFALAVFDDGSGAGPALYAGGWFSKAGSAEVSNIARWDGKEWSPLGSGLNAEVNSLVVFDDGSGDGPALYAGGEFTHAGEVMVSYIAKWDGRKWTSLDDGLGVAGSGVIVYDLTVFDDGRGDGPSLYAGGSFFMASGVTAKHIARWNGSEWSAVGGGTGGQNGSVFGLTAFDDGTSSGPELYAAGAFTIAGDVSANRIAKWDGTEWKPLGSGMSGFAGSFATFDDGLGGGSALYVGGTFTVSPAGDSYLAKWGCTRGEPCSIADFNCDGVVDGTDLAVVLGAWGACGSPPCAADLNDDGMIDGNDLAILLGAWG